MTVELTTLVIATISIAFGSLLGYFTRQSIAKHQRGTAEEHVSKMLSDAKAEARNILIGARDKSVKLLEDAKKEEQQLKMNVMQHEKRIFSKEATLDKKNLDMERRTEELTKKAARIQEVKKEIEEMREKEIKELERVAGTSAKDAKEELLVKVENEYKMELHDRLRKLESYGKETLEARARDILIGAMQK